jgi:hypothetical protein
MADKIVISCFDKTTNMVQPWAENGYLAYCVDISHPKGEHREKNIVRVGADIHNWIPPRGNIVFASFFPPCTDLSVSGARWFKGKGLHRLSDAIKLFARSVDIAETLSCPWIIENPVSTISSYWRKPDHIFDPCDYGDPYTKKTCLWSGNGFVMPEKKPVAPSLGSRMHLLPPHKDRADKRSVTPMGFAVHVFKANRNHETGYPGDIQQGSAVISR